jgi:hypothetical protein
LKKTPEQRLGMATCPAGDIYSQPFFASVEWKKVAKCQIKPPFVPELVILDSYLYINYLLKFVLILSRVHPLMSVILICISLKKSQL